MVDLDAIRAALAAALDPDSPEYEMWWAADKAPTWLAALCDEIERLRADLEGLSADHLEANQDLVSREQRLSELYEWLHEAEAERDAALRERDELVRSLDTSAASLEAALAEVERLRADERLEETAAEYERTIAHIEAERDAALAEVERLRNVYADIESYDQIADEDKATIEAWRACADQLAADLKFTVVQCKTTSPHKVWADGALAEYERLKGADS